MRAAGILHHIRNYASAGMLSALAGVVSFPILTRNLSIEEYGILGLITASLTLFIAVGKLGIQHSVIRFFAQIRHGNLPYSLDVLNSTVSSVFLALAVCTSILWLVAGYFVLPGFLQFEAISSLFLVACGVVFVRLLGSGVLNFMRAQQRSGVVAKTQVLGRYLNLSLIVALLLFSDINPWYLLACLLIAEVIAIGFAAFQYRRDFRLHPSEFSRPLASALLVYGLPLMILESLGLVLRLSDRYLIEAMMGENALGMYSASYSLTAYLEPIVIVSLMQAVKPMYMNLWEREGLASTREFLTDGLHIYLVLGLPFVALFSLASPHLMNLLASPKYEPGTIIIPFVAFSFLLDGAMLFLAAGLYIHKNTRALMVWGAVATGMNLLLNITFIPEYGILGAAVVTVVSFLVFLTGVSVQSFRYLSFPIRPIIPLLVGLYSAGTYAVLYRLSFSTEFSTMMAKGVLGVIALVTGILLIDPRMRQFCRSRLPGEWGRAHP